MNEEDTRVVDSQYPSKPLATAASHALVPRALIATTLVDSERQLALRWRDVFLHDDDPGTVAPLSPQIVAYLIEDHETLRKIADAVDGVNQQPRSVAVDPIAPRTVNGPRASERPSVSSADLTALVEQWKAKAAESRQWAAETQSWDGANRHELRNRAGVYDWCASQLAALLTRGGQP